MSDSRNKVPERLGEEAADPIDKLPVDRRDGSHMNEPVSKSADPTANDKR